VRRIRTASPRKALRSGEDPWNASDISEQTIFYSNRSSEFCLLACILLPAFDYHITIIRSNLNAEAFARQFFRCNQACTAPRSAARRVASATIAGSLVSSSSAMTFPQFFVGGSRPNNLLPIIHTPHLSYWPGAVRGDNNHFCPALLFSTKL
jgi:hypothetical protein